MVAFLRHVGCPFAELSVKRLRQWAARHPDVTVYVVSHGDPPATRAWLDRIGGLGRLQLVDDPGRCVYGRWGLGDSTLWHFAGPASLLGVVALWLQGIRNRDASGTRWQRSGMFLVRRGRVAWQHVPVSAQSFELPPYSLMNRASPP